MYNIAIDFGTTNTLIGVYNITTKEIIVENFKDLSYKIGDYHAIPSKIFYETKDRYKIGANVKPEMDGQRVFDRMKLYFNKLKSRSRKIESFKISPTEAASDFLSLVLDFVLVNYPIGQINKIILTAPVDSFDTYRVFLTEMCEKKQIYNYQILDEPTAVALGYNAIISPDYPYLIVDFGGGTLDINIVRVKNAKQVNQVDVLGKAGANFGGSDIDDWIMSDYLKQHNLSPDEICEHSNELKQKIEKLKIEVCQKGSAAFTITNKKADYDLSYNLTLEKLETILKNNNFVHKLQDTIDMAMEQAICNGVNKKQIKEVLLTGGSSLIPLTLEVLKNNFGDKIKHTEPYAAVIKGACNYIAGTIVEDFLHHNYSLQYFNKQRGIHDYEVIVSEKTKFPVKNIAQKVIAAPFNGQEELELKIVEVMSNIYENEVISRIDYDENGNLIAVKDQQNIEDQRKIVPLNSAQECFIKLNPPGIAGEARIKLNFHVSENRILTVDVVDMKTGMKLYDDLEVARVR